MLEARPPELSSDAAFTGRQSFFWLLLIALLAPWAWFAMRMAANSDILWLCTALTRVLHGGTLSGQAYETNPPLCIFTCLVPVLLAKLGIPLAQAITIYAFAAIALSIGATAHILRTSGIFTSAQVAAMAAGFASCETIMASNTYIAERDHLIALAYIPFVLVQLTITARAPWPRRTGIAALIIGAFLICIKPHYGLLPTLILLHRAMVQKRISVIKDPDFLALAAVTITSVAATLIFFPDWITTILPDVVHLYTPFRKASVNSETLKLAAAGIVIAGAVAALRLPPVSKRFVLAITLAALLSLIPFFVQGRGYHYHLMPAFGFAGLALGLLAQQALSRDIGAARAPFFAAFALAGAAYALFPPDIHYPTHQQYEAFPLTHLVATCGGQSNKPCPFFMFNDTLGITQETAYYAGAPHASRFPSFWFLPGLLYPDRSGLTPADHDRLFHKYASMAAQDLNDWKPPLLLIGHFDFGQGPFDFMKYFSADPAFADAMTHYHFQRTITLDRRVYNFGTLLQGQDKTPFDIYWRTGDDLRNTNSTLPK